MFVKRLGFVLLIVAVLSTLVGTAVAQSEPQQFVVYVQFKPANARTGGDVWCRRHRPSAAAPVLLIRATPRGAWFAAGNPKLD